MAIIAASSVLLIFGLLGLSSLAQVVYNLFFHPLRKYPGPLLWRASGLPKAIHLLMGTYPRKAVEFHERYPGTIRVSPNELSYMQATAWKDIFGRLLKNEFPKDTRFFGGDSLSNDSLSAAPPEAYARMRRLFNKAFTNTALQAQEPLFVRYADQMVRKMADLSVRDTRGGNGAINLVDLFNFCTFDIMADLTFGEPLRLLETGDYIPWVRLIFFGLKFIVWRAVLSDIPVLGPLLNALTAGPLQKKAREHMRFAADLVDRRVAAAQSEARWAGDDDNDDNDDKDHKDHKDEQGQGQGQQGQQQGHHADGKQKKKDIWSFVLRHAADEKGLSRPEMHANAAMLMIAGTETTATVASGVCYYLMRTPLVYQRLVAEIRAAFPRSEDITLSGLAGLEYLNAVLQEGLRLYVPGGSGMARIVPPGGAEICGDYVPGGTFVTLDYNVAYRHSANWSRPLEFIPERWLYPDAPEFAGDKKEVHEPFLYGPRNCVGKNLAWLELRLLLAKTLWHYDLEMCPESNDWIIQRNFLTWEKGPLMTRLIPVVRS
ncbi:toxin biosynthesis cytochrome P450 monooxygenase [Sodiomyces alkalinus F11]|uniref:Toxin biosynthesis cytochrome P450 monooxygenase n=1 Tax=Sodiomyces alkalinus (strain CBS 110278 / VKM F-3762 / F11) TaxID=1314773 RepID=A0A3N2PLU3_SODAK|nr:toxin biosynthesis cytochrome P450 monooxygenase [Sodiomyces alkalinus F11]ROT35380.1 toxin biosynthesis cytochrome P450 monooxygenase [Sodiomyces alkalinus F11]